MESHILNMYHQGPYRRIEDGGLRSISESVSSESSCNNNSPEYSQNQQISQECDSDDGEYWEHEERLQDSRDEDVNVSDSYQDDEEYIQVDNPSQPVQVIQVIVINPENEADVDDIELKCTNENDDQTYNAHDDGTMEDNVDEEDAELIHLNELGLHEDSPVVSNVDEYFVMKQNDESDILEVRDEPIVQDVDEYFIKDTQEPKLPPKEINVSKDESEGIDFRIPNNTEAFSVIDNVSKIEEQYSDTEQEDPNISINESDLEGLPNIEDLKRYILDDMPCIKVKNSHKCSVSLPHSPMHNICMDMDSKTCLSFEDLNLDLTDLTLENKGKSGISKNDDIPRTLTEEDINSFLITSLNKQAVYGKDEDDLSHQDMELDKTVGSIIQSNSPSRIESVTALRKCTSTPIPDSNIALDFGTDKCADVKESHARCDVDDYVDVESCNEIAIPVLKANNLNSLLEQFEATEKLNDSTKTQTISDKNTQVKSLPSGMRLQEAGIKLNKTKMRQILMPSTVKTSMKTSNPDYSDHNYCSKKRHSLPSLKGGQSLLKPEVLSSNNKILSSRHRSCKDKKVVYHLSSDEESDTVAKKNKLLHSRNNSASENKIKKPVDKQSIKSSINLNVNNQKKTPTKVKHTELENNSTKLCDTTDSADSNYRGSIKLTIKNKSEVIIKNCEPKHDRLEYDKTNEKSKSERPNSVSESVHKEINNPESDITRNTINLIKHEEKCVLSTENSSHVSVKEEVSSNPEDFYNALFSNKQDVCIPQTIKMESEEKNKDEDVQVVSEEPASIILEQPQKKRKLNLHEYKLRRGVSSNNNSAQVSPEAIFPDLPPNIILDKNMKENRNEPISVNIVVKKENDNSETPKTVFDPIREASRKIIMISKKQKAEAMRKRDEDIVMSKIPKVENLELQPLMSDLEMMQIVGFAPEVVQPPMTTEKNQVSKEFDEIVLVSIGTNTDENLLKCTDKPITKKRKSLSPQGDKKYTINFKIKKYDHVLRQNVFDPVKRDPHIEDINHSENKIDNERFKDITATLKSVEKQVDTKISSNSLFASIQDVVKKKAPVVKSPTTGDHKTTKVTSPVDKHEVFKFCNTTIVREYDINADHGEDKVILHLEKGRKRPESTVAMTQTDSSKALKSLCSTADPVLKEQSALPRKRNDSDMSVSSDDSPVCNNKAPVQPPRKEIKTAVVKPRTDPKKPSRSRSKDKRSRSRDRYDTKYRRSRSHSRGHRRKRSHSRNRSRSRGRFQRYRRSDSPYRRRRRSRTRSPYRRRSPSVRRDHRSNRSRSRSRHNDRKKSRSPIKRPSLKHSANLNDKKPTVSLTPPLRKTSVSETSDMSTSSSTSSSSSSSVSEKSRCSNNSYRREEAYRSKVSRSFSSEDRESNTPVEERRIVFVGKLEKDLTKAALRSKFSKFGPVTEVRLHSKEDGSRYGFVTYQRPRDAWSAVEAANTFPQYDVGFGGRRAFCRQSYADLDGLEAKYTESAFHGQQTLPARRNDDMSFEQMLLDMKNKLNKRKGERNRIDDDPTA